MRIIKPEGRKARDEFRAYIETLKASGKVDAEDVEAIDKWLAFKDTNWFVGKTIEDVMDWIPDNLLPELERMQADRSFQKAAGVPSESELEDALHWVDSCIVGVSEEQTKYARDIANRHHFGIVKAWKQGKTIPTAAAWWIENKNNIVGGALPL